MKDPRIMNESEGQGEYWFSGEYPIHFFICSLSFYESLTGVLVHSIRR